MHLTLRGAVRLRSLLGGSALPAWGALRAGSSVAVGAPAQPAGAAAAAGGVQISELRRYATPPSPVPPPRGAGAPPAAVPPRAVLEGAGSPAGGAHMPPALRALTTLRDTLGRVPPPDEVDRLASDALASLASPASPVGLGDLLDACNAVSQLTVSYRPRLGLRAGGAYEVTLAAGGTPWVGGRRLLSVFGRLAALVEDAAGAALAAARSAAALPPAAGGAEPASGCGVSTAIAEPLAKAVHTLLTQELGRQAHVTTVLLGVYALLACRTAGPAWQPIAPAAAFSPGHLLACAVKHELAADGALGRAGLVWGVLAGATAAVPPRQLGSVRYAAQLAMLVRSALRHPKPEGATTALDAVSPAALAAMHDEIAFANAALASPPLASAGAGADAVDANRAGQRAAILQQFQPESMHLRVTSALLLEALERGAVALVLGALAILQGGALQRVAAAAVAGAAPRSNVAAPGLPATAAGAAVDADVASSRALVDGLIRLARPCRFAQSRGRDFKLQPDVGTATDAHAKGLLVAVGGPADPIPAPGSFRPLDAAGALHALAAAWCLADAFFTGPPASEQSVGAAGAPPPPAAPERPIRVLCSRLAALVEADLRGITDASAHAEAPQLDFALLDAAAALDASRARGAPLTHLLLVEACRAVRVERLFGKGCYPPGLAAATPALPGGVGLRWLWERTSAEDVRVEAGVVLVAMCTRAVATAGAAEAAPALLSAACAAALVVMRKHTGATTTTQHVNIAAALAALAEAAGRPEPPGPARMLLAATVAQLDEALSASEPPAAAHERRDEGLSGLTLHSHLAVQAARFAALGRYARTHGAPLLAAALLQPVGAADVASAAALSPPVERPVEAAPPLPPPAPAAVDAAAHSAAVPAARAVARPPVALAVSVSPAAAVPVALAASGPGYAPAAAASVSAVGAVGVLPTVVVRVAEAPAAAAPACAPSEDAAVAPPRAGRAALRSHAKDGAASAVAGAPPATAAGAPPAFVAPLPLLVPASAPAGVAASDRVDTAAYAAMNARLALAATTLQYTAEHSAAVLDTAALLARMASPSSRAALAGQSVEGLCATLACTARLVAAASEASKASSCGAGVAAAVRSLQRAAAAWAFVAVPTLVGAESFVVGPLALQAGALHSVAQLAAVAGGADAGDAHTAALSGCCRQLEDVLLRRRAAVLWRDADVDALTLLAVTYAQLAEAGAAGATARARDVGDLVHLMLLHVTRRQRPPMRPDASLPEWWYQRLYFPTLGWVTLLKLAAASLNAAGRLFRASPPAAVLPVAAAAPASATPPALEAVATARSWVLAADVADAVLADVVHRGKWMAFLTVRKFDAHTRQQWDVVRAAARNGYAGSVDPATGTLRTPPSTALLQALASVGQATLRDCEPAVQGKTAAEPCEFPPALAVALAEVVATGIAESLLPRQPAQPLAHPLPFAVTVAPAAPAAAAPAAAPSTHLRAKYTSGFKPLMREKAILHAHQMKNRLAWTLHYVAASQPSHRESLDVAYALVLLDALMRPDEGRLPAEPIGALIEGINARLAGGEVGVGGVARRRAVALKAAISQYNAKRVPKQPELPSLLTREEL